MILVGLLSILLFTSGWASGGGRTIALEPTPEHPEATGTALIDNRHISLQARGLKPDAVYTVWFVRRMDTPSPSYKKRIINNMPNLYRVIRKGDVVLVEGRSELSRFIKVLTQSPWSHSVFHVGDALEGSAISAWNRTAE